MPTAIVTAQRLAKGVCRSCGRPRDEGHTRCRICLDNKRAYRNRLREQGRCMRCGVRLQMGEETRCCLNCREHHFHFQW